MKPEEEMKAESMVDSGQEKPVMDEPVMAEENTSQESETTASPETPGNQEIISIIERFAPGADTSTPDAIIAGALQVLQSLVPIYDKVYDVATTSPEAAAFVNDLLETGDVAKSLGRNYDPEELKALWDEVSDETYEEDRKVYSDKVSQHKMRESELEANKQKSQISAQEFLDKINPSDEELEAFIKYHEGFMRDAVDNNMSLDHWMRAWKGFKYDGTVAELKQEIVEAEENGRVAGRNETIERGKLSRKELAEQLPEIGGGSAAPSAPKKQSFAKNFMDNVL